MFRELLETLISGGGGVAIYALLNAWPWFGTRTPEEKRWIAIGASAIVGIVAFLASTAMLYTPTPIDWRGWVETIFSIALAIAAPGAGAFVVSQGLHARELASR